MGYYGGVIEIELVNDENEIIITTEYYKLRYDVSDNTRPVLLEDVQLRELPG